MLRSVGELRMKGMENEASMSLSFTYELFFIPNKTKIYPIILKFKMFGI